jgi:hypothetical protein
VIKPFTEEEIEEAIELFKKGWSECTEVEQQRRVELLAQLQLPENSETFLQRLISMAYPRGF